MELKILGCYGGEYLHFKTTCFRIGRNILLDAGAIATGMSIDQLVDIDHVVISHSHFDHVKDLTMMADIITGLRRRSVEIHGSPAVINALERHVFNGRMWPDFTKIPSRHNPTFTMRRFTPGREFELEGISFLPVKVHHSVETTGFIVRGPGGGAFAFSSDTGPTKDFWKKVNGTEGLKFVITEVSFPDEQAELARLSGHMTPAMFAREIRKLKKPGVPVKLFHLKPAFTAELEKMIKSMNLPDVSLLEQGETLEF
jgi:cAMP phosphodiesterase